MAIWTKEQTRTDSLRRPYCACCGLSYTNPKFGGKVIIANPPGEKGRVEVMFCEKCAKTEEAQEIYRDLMAIDKSGLTSSLTSSLIINPYGEA